MQRNRPGLCVGNGEGDGDEDGDCDGEDDGDDSNDDDGDGDGDRTREEKLHPDPAPHEKWRRYV